MKMLTTASLESDFTDSYIKERVYLKQFAVTNRVIKSNHTSTHDLYPFQMIKTNCKRL